MAYYKARFSGQLLEVKVTMLWFSLFRFTPGQGFCIDYRPGVAHYIPTCPGAAIVNDNHDALVNQYTFTPGARFFFDDSPGVAHYKPTCPGAALGSEGHVAMIQSIHIHPGARFLY